ncbi:RHS repeat-associated core domain-containing protein, partial [Moheibacter sediminis]
SYTKDPVSNELKIMEENHYYPFGLKHSTYADPKQKYELVDNMENTARPTYVLKTDYQYKYNGKELQDELGLNLYDYGARNYDPALGRWMNMDPLAEDYISHTPYAYALNNPVYYIDPDGMRVESGGPETKYTLQSVSYDKKTGNYTITENVTVNSSSSKFKFNSFGDSKLTTTHSTTSIDSKTVVNSKGEIVSSSNTINQTTSVVEKTVGDNLDMGTLVSSESKTSTDNSFAGPMAATFGDFSSAYPNSAKVAIKNDQDYEDDLRGREMPGCGDCPSSGWGKLGDALNRKISGKENSYVDVTTISRQGRPLTDFHFNYSGKTMFDKNLKKATQRKL